MNIIFDVYDHNHYTHPFLGYIYQSDNEPPMSPSHILHKHLRSYSLSWDVENPAVVVLEEGGAVAEGAVQDDGCDVDGCFEGCSGDCERVEMIRDDWHEV